jgi:hypothetical protein
MRRKKINSTIKKRMTLTFKTRKMKRKESTRRKKKYVHAYLPQPSYGKRQRIQEQ